MSRQRYLPNEFVRGETPLHQFHLTLKIALFLVYLSFVVVLSRTASLAVVLVGLLIGSVVLVADRALTRAHLFMGASAIALLLLDFTPVDKTTSTLIRLLAPFFILLVKLFTINRLIRWVAQTTPSYRIIHWLQKHLPRQWGSEIAYLISISLSSYPIIRRDVQTGVDAEHLRLGKTPSILALGIWMDILVNTLVRALQRSRNSAWSAISRSFMLDGTFILEPERPFQSPEIFASILCLIPIVLALVI